MTRPDRDEWHLRGALWLAEMGDCTRRQVGSLIVVDKRIVGLGYNGTRPGAKGCLEGACPRGRHYEHTTMCETDHSPHPCFVVNCRQVPVCACGNAWPCPDAVAPGSSYDTGPGACIATHAESNAKADAMQRGAGRMAGGVQYVSCEPCEGCVRDIRNTTDIEAMIWPDGVIALP
jgi:dCMP deaminase